MPSLANVTSRASPGLVEPEIERAERRGREHVVEHGVEVRERHRRADRHRDEVREKLAAALLDRRRCFGVRGFHLPLAGSSVTRPNAPPATLPSICIAPVSVPTAGGGGTLGGLIVGLGAADDLRLRGRAGVDLLRSAWSRAAARLRGRAARSTRARPGRSSSSAVENSCSARFLLPPLERRGGLVEQIGGLAQELRLLRGRPELARGRLRIGHRRRRGIGDLRRRVGVRAGGTRSAWRRRTTQESGKHRHPGQRGPDHHQRAIVRARREASAFRACFRGCSGSGEALRVC